MKTKEKENNISDALVNIMIDLAKKYTITKDESKLAKAISLAKDLSNNNNQEIDNLIKKENRNE